MWLEARTYVEVIRQAVHLIESFAQDKDRSDFVVDPLLRSDVTLRVPIFHGDGQDISVALPSVPHRIRHCPHQMNAPSTRFQVQE